MNPQLANRRCLLTISNTCCLSVLVFAGLICGVPSASAGIFTSGESATSAQVLSSIEGGNRQLGELAVWFDIGLADPMAPVVTGASSRAAATHNDIMVPGGSKPSETQLLLSVLPSMDFCVFTSSSNTGSTSGLSSSGFANGHGAFASAAILVPSMRLPAPVLNRFRRGADFVFVPPVVPDELLRPPQI